MKPIVIEGHKGAGKTPLIASMKKTLDDAKVDFFIAEPWQEAIKHFGADPFYLFSDPTKAKEIVYFLTDYVDNTIQQTPDSRLLIFDRQWLTFLTSVTLINPKEAGFSTDEYHEIFSRWMACKPWTVFIASTPHILKNRKSRKGPPPWNEDVDYWTRLNLFLTYRKLFSGIYWVRKSRIDMNALGNKILSDYYRASI